MTQIALVLFPFVLLWGINLFFHIRMRSLGRLVNRQRQQPLRTDSLPPVSIIISTHNQATELRHNLPLFLQQDYPQEYEVIVVDRHSDDDTMDLLEELEEQYPYLHHTYCPTTARDISLQRLALTLGIKAAGYEWVYITQADCQISGNQWLIAMMQSCDDSVDAVLGLTRFDHLRGWAGRRWEFFRLWQQMMWLPFALRYAPYRTDGISLCYRKSTFLRHQGFASHANLVSGAEALLVNHNVQRGRCAVNVRPDAVVLQSQPVDRMWNQERVFYMETRHNMHHTFLYRLLYFTAVMSNLLFPLLTIGLIVYFLPNYYIVASLAFLWFVLLIVKTTSYNFTARRVGTRTCYFTLPWFLHLVPLWDAKAWLTWLFTNKQTFRKKFV